ncbi:Rho-binding antiterminator [Shewanella gaetbuli]|uniref:Rho-binding antiterminator n=1 Tax=Shewanella gaetbuli TaxID=220752 RepID=A0A9X2CLV5_9GAMM|nr:Rho-binding antiterminator [Shewanella gaetbuli]MCL1143089.1 Rho-binding antiterminator [Shewanella gaetbuli]
MKQSEEQNILACEYHDYIEIICLYRYNVTITLTDNRLIQGQFHTTGFTTHQQHKYEVIKGFDDNQHPIEVKLTEIVKIDVNNQNAQFSSVRFDL